MTSRRLRFLVLLPACAALVAPARAKDESVFIFQERQVSINLPEGYTLTSRRDEQGNISVQVIDVKQKTDLAVRFLPDPRGRLAAEEGQMRFVADLAQPYAEGSVEKSYDFKPLEPHTGSGTYCVFTDASLKGKMPFPAGEYLNVTCGVKAWPDCVLVFTLLSNDTTSKEYEAALKLIRDSFEEIPAAKPL